MAARMTTTHPDHCPNEDRISTLENYTGINPMANGRSLRGQLSRLNLLLVISATAILTIVVASTWATRTDTKTVLEAAKQITAIAESFKAIK